MSKEKETKTDVQKALTKERFDHLVRQQKRKAEDHGPLLWSILVLGHWLQRNFS